MQQNEGDRLPDSQAIKHYAKVAYKVQRQKNSLCYDIFRLPPNGELNTGSLHFSIGQCERRKEEVCLISHEAQKKFPLPLKIFRTKGNERNIDIGVEVMLIRMTVMFIMPDRPPLITETYQQIPGNET